MFDLIVIGAGSAGAVVASRVSENAQMSVCLIEAGPDYSHIETTPHDLINSHNNSYRDHDWHLKYQPTSNRTQHFPRGRVTGGSSAVNTCIALRGMPEDYDEWAALGNTEWCFDKVLPAFNRLERDLDFGQHDYHGDAGPISIKRYQTNDMLVQHQAFLETANKLGYPECPDANAPYSTGAGPQPMNKIGQLRISSAIGYLAGARLRPNLEIQANTTVTRLIIKNKICTGVEVETPTGEISLLTAKCIVLSAGAIMSPAILMRSGIGPKDQLEKQGIDVLVNEAGVGQNLADHPAISVIAEVNDPCLIDLNAPIIQTILRYTAPHSDKRNDLQIEQLSFIDTRDNKPKFGIAAVLEYQYGRGELTLQSADPHVAPKIDMHFCEHEKDLQRLVACYKQAIRFMQEKPLADMVKKVTFPDPKRVQYDDDLKQICQRFSASGFHPCGTVKMGTDKLAVVDQFGCAKHIDNLVVADASIMPTVPSANINLTCIMIGEKIGEWIRTQPARYGL